MRSHVFLLFSHIVYRRRVPPRAHGVWSLDAAVTLLGGITPGLLYFLFSSPPSFLCYVFGYFRACALTSCVRLDARMR